MVEGQVPSEPAGDGGDAGNGEPGPRPCPGPCGQHRGGQHPGNDAGDHDVTDGEHGRLDLQGGYRGSIHVTTVTNDTPDRLYWLRIAPSRVASTLWWDGSETA